MRNLGQLLSNKLSYGILGSAQSALQAVCVRLVGQLPRSLPFRKHRGMNAHGTVYAGPTPTKGMSPFSCPLASQRTFATPLKRCGVVVPMTGHRLKPVDDLPGVGRMLSIQCPAHNDALDGLGHVQPTAPQWCLEREDTLTKHPAQ